ncbi:MAG: flagellar protein export ATPase FliI [Rhodocyclaceae bacterium]|nr:flagellar protein export ATPase FliI [Rhodocyclaceae bacterium]
MSLQSLSRYLADCRQLVREAEPSLLGGRLTRINGLVIEASGLKLPLGATAHIHVGERQRGQTGPGKAEVVEAEVVGFSGERLFMMPSDDVYGLAPGMLVTAQDHAVDIPRPGQPLPATRHARDRAKHLPVGDALLGRVVDGNGRPLDTLGPVRLTETRSLASRPLNPLQREPIRDSMDVGIRAINSLLTVGRGQRLGLFAGSGVGKSVLLGMMARYTAADVIVVGLIGERGREVKEFIEMNLGEEGLARSVVVAAPADVSPLMRLQGASYATAIAEHFRDRGQHVLLIMDSLTRYAMAQREIALAIGEPPVTRGYPPSVFARLPQLVERAGNGMSGGGSITAFYTVLAEGDDQQDPIADAARAILDGHIVLSRQLADAGHYPAIDIEQSISRVAPNLIDAAQLGQVRQFKQYYSRYQRARDLLAVGAYQAGSDPVLDQAIRLYPIFEAFLQQAIDERAELPAAWYDLGRIFGAH